VSGNVSETVISGQAATTAMPYINVQQAAAATGLANSTILRAIKAGKISAVRDEHGQWQIEPAELQRVFAPVPVFASTAANALEGAYALEGNDNRNDTHRALAESSRRRALAEQRVAELWVAHDAMQRQRDDLRLPSRTSIRPILARA
jgi:excisionase family DNA binding protein